ncbi:MAG: pyridoxamine 5'-phosphate oxidase family protein [Actinomycetota bacterium]|nr:pyridoxamine 5'-phosphate oxidase family protein [Actinomycetota bacterium]
MQTVDDLVLANRRAGVAEVCWSDAQGDPRALAVVPLEHENRPALALHWSQWSEARELASCPQVAWVLSDRRMAQRGWEPAVGSGRMRLLVDDDGSVFKESMLDQELHKHPPSRGFADSLVLRRENWWFLPRLILVLDPLVASPVGERTHPDRSGVLVVGSPDATVSVDTVAVNVDQGSRMSGEYISCTSLGGLAPMAAGPALLLQHDFSVPDLERWGRRITSGRWDGERLQVLRGSIAEPPSPLIPPIPGLLERMRRRREFERDIRRALRAVAR